MLVSNCIYNTKKLLLKLNQLGILAMFMSFQLKLHYTDIYKIS